MEELWKKCKELFLRFMGGDSKKKILIFLGIGGMILLLLSEWIPAKSKTDKTDKESTSASQPAASQGEYAETMEKKLTETVGNISGVGACKVMITLENGTESVYAKDSQESDSVENGYDAQGRETKKEENKNDSQYIIIKEENGEKALRVKEIEPRVRGVIVVCEGGEDAMVRQRIIEAMTALFDIPSTRVCISKMQSQ